MSIDLILIIFGLEHLHDVLLWDQPLAKEIVNVPARLRRAHDDGLSSGARRRAPGVQMAKMLPLPNIDNKQFEHASVGRGEHNKLYTFGPKDYANTSGIWSGTADWADGAELKVVPGHPEGGEALPGTHNAAGFAPEHDPAELDIAKRLMKNI
jgi:hypothetical protein